MATIAGGAPAQLRQEAEAELCISRLPPEQRRAQLLDPTDGPQRFLTLKRRLQMLREIGGPR